MTFNKHGSPPRGRKIARIAIIAILCCVHFFMEVERERKVIPHFAPKLLKEESLLVETTLIIATVPYDRDHAKALWSHLECLTDKIDRVLLAAPDAEWSRRIVEPVIESFMLQAAINRKSVPIIEPLYFDNNRYDVGLWCDALIHYGYSPNVDNSSSSSSSSSSSNSSTPQAIFLINDSAFTRRNYNNLTERIIGATMQEQEEKHDGNSTNIETETPLKLLSLNGRISRTSPPGSRYNWVESVYRGFTPQGLMTFMKHSCSPAAARKCLGKDARCIVDSFEISLSGAYEKGAAGGIYPSFYPSDEEMKDWERRGINMTGSKKLWGSTSWIHGKEYYRYLVDEFDFPLLRSRQYERQTGGIWRKLLSATA